MKKLTYFSFLSIICLAMLFPQTGHAAQVKDHSIYVDGVPITIPTVWYNNHQLVPASFFRQMNAHVDWDAKYRTALISDGHIIVGYPSGRNYVNYAYLSSESIQWQQARLNTITKHLNDRVFVPLAYTVKKLGMDIYFDGKQKKTYIYSNAERNNLAFKGEIHTLIASATAQSQPMRVANITDEELQWLYQITEAEAGGESYEGKVAVAATILNRVDSKEWPDTILDVIFQVTYYNGRAYYQYSPVLDKRIYIVNPSQETKDAVHDALAGVDPTNGATVFYNPSKTSNKWVRSRPMTTVIGNHVFAL